MAEPRPGAPRSPETAQPNEFQALSTDALFSLAETINLADPRIPTLRAAVHERVKQLNHETAEAQIKLDLIEADLFGIPKELTPEQQMQLAAKIEIHGDPYQGNLLTAKELMDAGLGPRHEVRVSDKLTMALSAPYDLGSGRVAIVGYVPDGDRTIVRTYYLSNSHGVWKYLPHYTVNTSGEINWFGKGYSQASIALPHTLQRAIATLNETAPPIPVKDPKRVFAGTARPTPGSYPNPKSNITYVREVGFNAQPLPGRFAKPLAEQTKRDPLILPSTIRFERQEDQPHYGRAIYSYQQPSNLYGPITIEVIPSNNAELLYHVARDARNRVWIANVENRSAITSLGVRTSYVDAGNLTTPAFDYNTEVGDYGNQDLRSGYYIDTFKNYLSKIPIIQEYYRRRHLQPPTTI